MYTSFLNRQISITYYGHASLVKNGRLLILCTLIHNPKSDCFSCICAPDKPAYYIFSTGSAHPGACDFCTLDFFLSKAVDMRAIWTGAIGFGLVNIPVKLYSAVESENKIALEMLDKHDLSKIRFKRVNENTGKEVALADIVKGYKIEDDYVIVTDEDFEQASPKKSKVIEIQEFVEECNVDPALFEAPYYLEPAKGGEKAYALLVQALKETGKAAVGLFVFHKRENLCLVKPNSEGFLMLERMRFADEIRPATKLEKPEDVDLKPAEVKMAKTLIDQLTPKEFDPSVYKDHYREELMTLIEAKAKGKAPKPKSHIKIARKNTDLISQLKASLEVTPKKVRKAS
jgi:DNA end-binding protein Ku